MLSLFVSLDGSSLDDTERPACDLARSLCLGLSGTALTMVVAVSAGRERFEVLGGDLPRVMASEGDLLALTLSLTTVAASCATLVADDTLSRAISVSGGALRGHVRLKKDCVEGELYVGTGRESPTERDSFLGVEGGTGWLGPDEVSGGGGGCEDCGREEF